MPNPFTDPMVEVKLRNDPKTSGYLDDPEFMAKLKSLQMNPQSLMQHMQDKRVMDALGVLLGIDLQAMGKGAGELGW